MGMGMGLWNIKNRHQKWDGDPSGHDFAEYKLHSKE